MICIECNEELDESSEETIAQINKYADKPCEELCDECRWQRLNATGTIQ